MSDQTLIKAIMINGGTEPLTEEEIGRVKEILGTDVDLNARDEMGSTALWWAATKGPVKLVELLLEKGANVDAKDNYGETPLMKACINSKIDIAKLLIEKGADVDARSEMGSPLMNAASQGNLELVKLLVEKGAEILSSYITLASINNHKDIEKFLEEKKK